MLPVLVEQIRNRKGLPFEPPKASESIDTEQVSLEYFLI
jgi:hypothetical protein